MPETTLARRDAAAAADAYRTTGSSPTARRRTGDTVHLLGPGAVGRAVLARLATSQRRLVAITDSTATLFAPAGIDPRAVIRWKEAGRPLHEHPAAHVLPASQAIALADADLLVDTTATDLERRGWADAAHGALRRGAAIAFAAKAAVCERGAEWLTGEHASRVGVNAVLGGTGRTLVDELPALQRHCSGIALAGSASTTAILEAVERGATLAEGIAAAQRLGFLEPNPEQDLRGDDAAVKLAIVAGLITQRRIDPRSIACEDIRHIDLFAVRARARRGATTRLIGRWQDGTLRVAYEEVSRESLLAVPSGRVVYEYLLGRDERRFHLGRGLGADATAAALWADIDPIARALHAAAHAAPAGVQ